MMRELHLFRGERLSITAIARRTGLDRHVIGTRIGKGMTAEQAVAEPIPPRRPSGPEPKRYVFRDRWLTAKEIAPILGVTPQSVRNRASGRRILDDEEMKAAPGRVDAALVTHNGETRTVTEWAKITGLTRATIFSRLFNGWAADKALSVSPSPSGRGAPKARNRTIIRRIATTFHEVRA